VLGRGEQEDCVEPELQGRAGLLEDGTDHRVNVMAAPLAGISLFIGQLVPFSGAFALGADMALSKPHIKEVL
jgi:hypothetical protein